LNPDIARILERSDKSLPIGSWNGSEPNEWRLRKLADLPFLRGKTTGSALGGLEIGRDIMNDWKGADTEGVLFRRLMKAVARY
jgi:hypothetical protein